MMSLDVRIVWTTAALIVAAFTCAETDAATVSFGHSIEFSGATPPASAATPWILAEFDDGGSAGSVTLTLSTPNLTTGEFVSNWAFNLAPALDPTALIFSTPTKVGSFDDPTITTGVDFYKADGDGLYDLRIEFATGGGPGGSASHRFGLGDSVSYTISGIATLTADSFDFLSFPDGGNGPFHVAAHVQGIGAGGNFSGWTTTPEPASAALLAIGGALALGRRTRR